MNILRKFRGAAPMAALSLMVGGVMTQALATVCCLEIDGNCPPVHGPGYALPGINCSYGVCCIGAGTNGELVRRCCLYGHCLFSETQEGQIVVKCGGTVPWGTDPW